MNVHTLHGKNFEKNTFIIMVSLDFQAYHIKNSCHTKFPTKFGVELYLQFEAIFLCSSFFKSCTL